MTSNSATGFVQKRHSVKSATFFSVFGFGLSQVIRLAGNLLMTRLLLPEAFGLVAAAITISGLLVMMSDIGISTSVIKSASTEKQKFLNTAWTLQVLRDVGIGTMMVLFGFILLLLQRNEIVRADTIFADPRLITVLWFCSIATFVKAFHSIKLPLAQRAMNLRPIVIMEISAQLISIVVMVLAVKLGAGVYGLVLGMITSSVLLLICYEVFLEGPRARFEIDREYFDEIFHFGKWLILASLFGFLANKGDQFIFGTVLTQDVFSYYAIAMIWIVAFETLYTSVLSKVCFPTASEGLRVNDPKLTEQYLKFRNAADLICSVAFFGLFLFVDEIFDFLYPDNYQTVTVYMKLLAPLLFFYSYRILNIYILASGNSKMFTLITGVLGGTIVIVTPIVYNFFGAVPAIISVSVAPIAGLPLILYLAGKRLKLNYVRELFPAILGIAAALYNLWHWPSYF